MIFTNSLHANVLFLGKVKDKITALSHLANGGVLAPSVERRFYNCNCMVQIIPHRLL